MDREAIKDEVFSARPDFVIHLAAISFVGSPDKSSFYTVNVIGTTILLDVISELPKAPKKVLLASSANVYGNCDISPIDEAVIPNPINHYAMSKFAMEKMALTYRDRIPLVISRPFNYTGPGQDIKFVIPKIVDHFLNKNSSISLGNIDVEREFNDVRMVCDLYLKLLSVGVSGEVYNVCTGDTYSLETVVGILEDLTGYSITVKSDPEFVRPNELFRLSGNSAKINKLLKSQLITLPDFSLEQTLKSMLIDNHPID